MFDLHLNMLIRSLKIITPSTMINQYSCMVQICRRKILVLVTIVIHALTKRRLGA